MIKLKKDLTGKKINRITVVSLFGRGEEGKIYYNCVCDCGKKILMRADRLNGKTMSCGCYQKEIAKKMILTRCTTHGEAHLTKEWKAWVGMKERCHNSNSNRFKTYGGRGIKICDRWLNSYENFLSDMGRAPSKKHSIDRINNDGDYTPENCRWATQEQQDNNRTNNVVLSVFGDRMTVSQASKRFEIPYKTLHARVTRYGWPHEKAVTEPLMFK